MILIEHFCLFKKENKKKFLKKNHGFVDSEFVKTCHEHVICLKNCVFTVFCIIKKVGIFHKLSIKLDSIESDIIERISTEYVMYSKLCAIYLGLLNSAAHLKFKGSLCIGALVFNICTKRFPISLSSQEL